MRSSCKSPSEAGRGPLVRWCRWLVELGALRLRCCPIRFSVAAHGVSLAKLCRSIVAPTAPDFQATKPRFRLGVQSRVWRRQLCYDPFRSPLNRMGYRI